MAKWISVNLSGSVSIFVRKMIPDKSEDKRKAAEFNSIIIDNAATAAVCCAHGHLSEFGGIKWECGLIIGRQQILFLVPSSCPRPESDSGSAARGGVTLFTLS